MGWTDENPSNANLDRIRAVARARQAAADDVSGALTHLGNAVAEASEAHWKGNAREKFLALTAGARPDLERLSRGLGHHAEHLNQYADTLEELQHTEQLLRGRRDELDGERFAAGYVLGNFMVRAGNTQSTGAHEAKRSEYERRIEDAEAGLADVEIEWQELIAARRTADATLVLHLGDRAAGVARVDDLAIASSSAAGLLEELATMSPTDLAVLLELHPELADKLLQARPDDVAAWWASLAPAAKRAFINGMPAVIGNLGGVPYRMRDLANRVNLDRAISRLAGNPRKADEYEALRDVRKALALGTTASPAQLISLDVDALPTPLAAIAIGNLDTATNTTFQVSGMFSSTTDMTLRVDEALTLKEDEDAFARRLGMTGTTAVVAWIGYSSPDAATVLAADHAERGAELLAAELRAYDATVGAEKTLNVNAHSYGTTTAALALTKTGVEVDSFSMYGSAGLTDLDLNELNVPDGVVYVGQAVDDDLATIGRLLSGRQDPGEWLGVQRYDTNGGDVDPITESTFPDTKGHNEYLVPGSETIRNLALINLGRGELATEDKYIVPASAAGH
ncbi:alpha/beta hydrolase [Agromyces sp. NPDC057679]|uniref:alpha/beta hydrolase n=1 Tax=Agromyces sp. NPDC057679 TaxID=3346207 RepID=UPI00366C1312